MATFHHALAEHLAAIRARDLDRLAKTVSQREVALVTARGEVSTDPARFLALHAEWFLSSSWSIETRVLHQRVGADVATCILALDYRDRRSDGTALHERSILALVFAIEDGRWVMVQDQNTPRG